MTTEPYFQHQLYQLATQHFQRGEWRAGLGEIEQLIQIFPSEQDLRSLQKEFLFKERLDGAESVDRLAEKRGRWSARAIRITAVVIFALAATLLISTYSSWMGNQLTTARQQVEHEIQAVALAGMERDAKALMQVGRLAEAEAVIGEIAALDAEYSGLESLRAELNDELALFNLYEEGLLRINSGDWLGAKANLQQLAENEPNYRDVGLQLMYVDRQTLVGNLLSEGEAAMARADWEQAVTSFDSVRTLHPEHEPEYVQTRLFESFVNAGRAVLVGREDSLGALEEAAIYLRKALALRPQDPEIKRERELAGLYISAQAAFAEGNWSDVIAALTRTVDVDPDYAQGTARQTLYDAYVARGELQMAVHAYEAALSDFEQAVALGRQEEGAALRLFESELKVAEAYGAKGLFEAAVVHYRAAAEWGDVESSMENNTALLAELQEANNFAARGNFGVSYESFQRAFSLVNANQFSKIHVVEAGEYLTLLASRYGSTVRAIALANGIENHNLIFPGQELLIPVLP